MSTDDVPGHNPANNDKLATGCWAEHKDGSLVFVLGNEANRVIFVVFDMSRDPVIEYKDSMPEINFKREFSWNGTKDKIRWTWHDKTPFPWDKVIAEGARDGFQYASAGGLMTAAQRVAESLSMRGRELDRAGYEHLQEQELSRTGAIFARLDKALTNLPHTIAAAIQSTIGKKPPASKKAIKRKK